MLESLGDLSGVCREEASIITGLNPKGCLIINGDNPDLVAAVGAYQGQKIRFGFDRKNDLFATDVHCDAKGVQFNLNGSLRRRVFVPMLGKHTAANALAAIAVGRKMGLAEEAIIDNLAHAHGPDMRLQLQKLGQVTVLNDAYNSNPNSLKAAVETLAALPAKGRKVAVLGDMLELGEQSDHYHDEAGEFAASCRFEMLICVGKNAQRIAKAAQLAGMKDRSIIRFTDAAAAAKGILKKLRRDDLVLLKGSRSIGLETIAATIAQHSAPTRSRKAAS